MFSSCFKINSSTLSEATKTDLYWVWRVNRGEHLVGKGGSKARIHVQLRRHGRSGLALVLNIQLVTKTVDGWDALTLRASNELYKLTSQAFPNGAPVTSRGLRISVPEFYNSLYIPDKDTVVPANIQPSTLNCELMPFQQRAVQWMLRREGVDLDPNAGALMPYDPRNELDVPLTFFKNTDKAGQTVYVSHILGVITKSRAAARECLQQLRGGILAEEMGLGKTVELIALLSLHKREFTLGDKMDFEERKIQVTGSTLIVCPNSILQQWISEIRNHAPSMKGTH